MTYTIEWDRKGIGIVSAVLSGDDDLRLTAVGPDDEECLAALRRYLEAEHPDSLPEFEALIND